MRPASQPVVLFSIMNDEATVIVNINTAESYTNKDFEMRK